MVLKRRYELLLKEPSGWKKALIKIIHDIDERLKLLETGQVIDGIFSKVNHTHEFEYANINHNHDDLYSPLIHTHDTMCYVATFKLKGTSGMMAVKLKSTQVSLDSILLIEQGTGIDIVSIDGNYAIIDFNISESLVNKPLHLLYWTETGDIGTMNTNIDVSDVTGNLGSTVTLHSVVTDENNNLVNDGVVEYEIKE